MKKQMPRKQARRMKTFPLYALKRGRDIIMFSTFLPSLKDVMAQDDHGGLRIVLGYFRELPPAKKARKA